MKKKVKTYNSFRFINGDMEISTKAPDGKEWFEPKWETNFTPPTQKLPKRKKVK